MDETTIKIVLRSARGVSPGKVHLVAVPRQEAVKKGLIGWLGCWAVAIVTLPIPLVHFIAPPLLLLIGPVIGIGVYKLYHGAVDISQGDGTCPDCGAAVAIGARPEHWPMHLSCVGCQARIIVRPEADGGSTTH